LDFRQELLLEATVSFTLESLLLGEVLVAVRSDLAALDADVGCRGLVARASCSETVAWLRSTRARGSFGLRICQHSGASF
jgi:hypothetical protein